MLENLEWNMYDDVRRDIGDGVINVQSTELTGEDVLRLVFALERKVIDIKQDLIIYSKINLEDKDKALLKHFIDLFKNDTDIFIDSSTCVSAIKLAEPEFVKVNDVYISDVVKMLEDKSTDIYSNKIVNKFIREAYNRDAQDTESVFGISIIDYAMDHEILYSYTEVIDELKDILNKM